MALEDFEGLAIMFMIFIMSISAGLLWMDSTSTFQDNGLEIGISEGTLLDQSDLELGTLSDDVSVAENQIKDAESQGDIFSILSQFVSTLQRLIATLLALFLGWTYLLNAIFASVPGGTFFVVILTPLIGTIQVVALFLIIRRSASVIFGG